MIGHKRDCRIFWGGSFNEFFKSDRIALSDPVNRWAGALHGRKILESESICGWVDGKYDLLGCHCVTGDLDQANSKLPGGGLTDPTMGLAQPGRFILVSQSLVCSVEHHQHRARDVYHFIYQSQ